MYYAILAAGEGSRLRNEGIVTPKPLVKLGEETLLGRLTRLLSHRADCAGLSVIINSETAVAASENGEAWLRDTVVTVEETHGSMDSLSRLAPQIRESGESHLCLMTVDSMWRPEEFDAYVKAFADLDGSADGLMAVTDYVDDERPLWVATDDEGWITGFYDNPVEGQPYVSGGVYLLPTSALDILDECRDKGLHRMRDFQRALTANGLRLKAHPFETIIDIDHAADLEAARRLLNL